MSTFIKFKYGGICAHIIDICVCGETLHKLVETGRVYESEHTAVKRAIIYYRKRIRNQEDLKRQRRSIRRRRKEIIVECTNLEIPIPKIYTYRNEEGEIVHRVQETGREFKRPQMALRNAINYAKNRRIK